MSTSACDLGKENGFHKLVLFDFKSSSFKGYNFIKPPFKYPDKFVLPPVEPCARLATSKCVNQCISATLNRKSVLLLGEDEDGALRPNEAEG